MAVPAVTRFLGRKLTLWPLRSVPIEDERILAAARAVLATGILMIEAIGLTYGPVASLTGAQFDANGLIMRAVYLAIFGFLIGYLAESEKQRRTEALNISRLSAMARVDAGLKGTLQAVLPELLKLFRGRTLLLLTSETETNRTYLWRTEAFDKMGETAFTARQLDTAEARGYLFPLPGDCGGAVWRGRSRMSTILIGGGGGRKQD